MQTPSPNNASEPTGIWRKPWRGWRGFLLWASLLALGAYIVSFSISVAMDENVSDFWLPNIVSSLVCGFVISGIIAFGRWLGSWGNFRRFLIGVAGVVTFVALAVTEENWRGSHEWLAYKRAHEAKGEKFSLPEITPALVPDEENFATAPIVVTSYAASFDAAGHQHPYNSNVVNRLTMPTEILPDQLENKAKANWMLGQKTTLDKWQDYYQKLAAFSNYFPVPTQPISPAADVLFALSRYDGVIAELHQAAQRPRSRFPLNYAENNPAAMLLPHLAAMKSVVRTVGLRASAELDLGQSDKALGDVNLMFRVMEAIHSEPLLISHLVRFAMLHLTLQCVWDGVVDHRWNDAQLAALGAELNKLDFLADFQFAMRGERAFGIGATEYLRRTRDFRSLFNAMDSGAPVNKVEDAMNNIGFRLIPSGWFEQNKLSLARMYDEQIFTLADPKERRVSVEATRRAQTKAEQIPMSPYSWFGRMLFPAIIRTSEKAARSQAFTDLARVGIALERYRLAHGNYPDMLNSLAPQYLNEIPHDIIDGQPLRYHRTDAGQFVLYSVAWNGKDDGGVVFAKKTGGVDFEKGDWVWYSAAK